MTTSQTGSSRRSMVLTANSRKKPSENGPNDPTRRSISTSRSMGVTGERTVKRLRLSKALTVPDSTTIIEACRRMSARKVDAILLTDSNALLCGILTDKDITARVVARELDLETTPVSAVMTKNPVFVISDTLAVEALQKMVIGKFRHLPVVENGEVVAILDIAKCLYDAIARMERAAEKGKAIAAAVEGVEKHWGTSASGSNTFIETLRERLFKPSLSTIISENIKLVTISPSDTVLMAAKTMLECRISSAIVTVDRKPHGILTSKDILMRVIAKGLPPESTLVEKVMTPNPECANFDTPIVEALHIMQNGKFLHLPVLDKDGNVVAITDVLHITHAAVASVGSTAGIDSDATNSMMQTFWDSAMAAPADDDSETRSESSYRLASEGGPDIGKAIYPSPTLPTFAFKIQDQKNRMHRFICETHSLTDLITAILQRVGGEIDRNNLPQILYEDEDKDMVILATDSDLVAAVEHARSAGWKTLEDMLRACALDWKGNWDEYICFVECAYNNSWQASIKMAPYEMLYGRKCRAPICWNEAGETTIEGPEVVRLTNEKVVIDTQRLKEAQSRQKTYTDKHRRVLDFDVGDRVFLKVSPCRGVRRFGIRGKLSPRYIGPFEILERVGVVSYRLALPPQLSRVHNVFHVSLFRGYNYHPLHVIHNPLDDIRKDLSYVEKPIAILDREDQITRRRTISFVKVLWENHSESEARWELESTMRAEHPHLFNLRISS